MKTTPTLSGLALALALSANQTHAQSATDKPVEIPDARGVTKAVEIPDAKTTTRPAVNQYGDRLDRFDSHPFQTFYLHNAGAVQDANEILTGLRLILEPSVKLYLVPSQNAVMIRGTEEQIAQAQRIITELDKPKKDYRLNYTITESDNGKRIGVSHLAMTTSSGQRSTIKQGSKVPIVTGSYDEGKNGQQTQFTYLDIGVNLDATVTDMANAVVLKNKAEQSSIAEEKSGVGTDPIVRQSILESVTVIPLGKPIVLGSLDVPGSTRHLDIEVVVDQIK